MLLAAAIGSLFVDDSTARTSKPPPPKGCSESFSRSDFHRLARVTYRTHSPVTARRKRQIRKRVYCQAYPKSVPIVRHHLAKYKRGHAYRLQVAAVTPYRGPDGRRWAIPWYIVACESHGSWGAYNPSSALGPYQLLGKGAPFPANTRAKRLAHHRIAFNLYAGGAGASHWVCA